MAGNFGYPKLRPHCFDERRALRECINMREYFHDNPVVDGMEAPKVDCFEVYNEFFGCFLGNCIWRSPEATKDLVAAAAKLQRKFSSPLPPPPQKPEEVKKH
eukprot:TRINITY_DN3158_c0_g1_i1.p2 TRINITY_DN3158_c0_g1~~TRINITY_DN3158_c0_g1_i1.p2  ORF type:complete len:102 (-),score=17.14 TRINITY_DN3158_c0_g1_i1:168-473(-)